jgi:phosphomevalonate kinase
MSKPFVKYTKPKKKRKLKILFNLFSFCPLEDADYNCFISFRYYKKPNEEFFAWAYTIKSNNEIITQDRVKVPFHVGISEFSLVYTAINRVFDYFISNGLTEAKINLFSESPLILDQMAGNVKINPKAHCADLAWEIQDKIVEFYNLRLNFITRTANLENYNYIKELS